MNEDVQQMAIYAGVGGVGLVGGHMAVGAIKDKVVDHKRAKESERVLAEHQAQKAEKLRISAENKGIDPNSRVGQAYMQKNFFGRLLTKGR